MINNEEKDDIWIDDGRRCISLNIIGILLLYNNHL